MKTHFSFKHLLFLGGAVLYSLQSSAVKNPVDYVSTLVGTQSKFELSTGNTYPATALPWGMNFWTPQTGKMGDGWAYTYDADKIRGFKQTHQPSPWMNDYGQFAIMPITGGLVFDQDRRASWFSHKAEVAKPYYYKVYLADHDVTTELAPTERAVMFRFTYPETKNAYVIVDAFDKGSYVKVIPKENKIIGYSTKNSGGVPENFKNYFVVQFDKPFTFVSTVSENNILPNEIEAKGNHTGAVIGFATKKGEIVHARVASSFISPEQAELNLKELGRNSFDQLVTNGRDVWNREMSKIEVEDDNIDNLRTFYSCLYRSMLFPRSFYEIDAKGEIMHYSPYNGEVRPGYMFTDTGFWDTFRCLFPFLNLMYPSMNLKMQEGLVNAYKESGFLPEWASPGHRDCMVGNNSASVVADAYIKGLRGYDIETLWEALKHGANAHLRGTASGRLGYESYNQLGYVANNIGIGQNVDNPGGGLFPDVAVKPEAGADIDLLDAWQLCTGSEEVIVAVIDEPVQTTHPDLRANIWSNPKNSQEHGYNFWDDTPELDWKSVGGDDRNPEYADHGTHVAGVIAAVNNNGRGVCGIAGGRSNSGGVRIMSCQIMGNSTTGGKGNPTVKAFEYAWTNGAIIAQNSWGYNLETADGTKITPEEFEREWKSNYGIMRDAIDTFVRGAGTRNPNSPLQGGLVIFAAGNEGDVYCITMLWLEYWIEVETYNFFPDRKSVV